MSTWQSARSRPRASSLDERRMRENAALPGEGIAPIATGPHVLLPPARRARRIALVLSVIAVIFSLACGFGARRTYALYVQKAEPEVLMPWVIASLALLLVALLLRMSATICELFWLERTWSNLPEPLRKVGPINEVSSGVALAIHFVPGVAWLWKLGVVVGIARGFEAIRAQAPFTAPVPRRLGMAAVMVGWLPGLNVYIAPFLWEVFANRIDACVDQILAREPPRVTSDVPT
jgi:hypothetical protein